MQAAAQPAPIDAATTTLRTLGLAAAAAAAFISVGAVLVLARGVPGIDFYQFWVVGTELRHDGAPHIYSNQQRTALARTWLSRAKHIRGRLLHAASLRPKLETFSTPVLYSGFAALSTGNYELDHRRYRLYCLLVSTVAIGVLCRLFAYSWTRTLMAIVLFFGLYAPLQSDVIVTNVNQLQLGGLAIYLWAQSRNEWRLRDYFGGGVLGLLLAVKPNIAISIAMLYLTWGINRRWGKLGRQTIGLVLALVVAVAASVWVFRSADCWPEWAVSLHQLTEVATFPIDTGNVGLAMLIEESTGRRVSTFLLATLAGIALAAVARGGRRLPAADRGTDLEEDLLAISLGVIVMLLSARLVWCHYFVLLIPTAIYCLRPQSALGRDRRPIAGRPGIALVATLLIAGLPPILTAALPESWILALPGDPWQSVCVSLGTLLMFGLVVRETQSSVPESGMRSELVNSKLVVSTGRTARNPNFQTPAKWPQIVR